MKEKGKCGFSAVLASGLLLLTVLSILIAPSVNATECRGAGEDIRIDISVDFIGITEMTGDVLIEIHVININGTLMTSDEIRSAYDRDINISLDVDDEIIGRIDYTISSMLTGDQIVIDDRILDEDTLVNNTENQGEPIIYTMNVRAVTPAESFLPPGRIESVGEGRIDHVLASLLLCGFTYERSVNITAEEGEIVTVHLSDEIDPFDDEALILPVDSVWPKDTDGYYTITVDGSMGDLTRAFSFSIPSSYRIDPTEEAYTGTMDVDWFALNSIAINGMVDIESIDIQDRDIFSDIPDSVDVPDFVPSSLIRELHIEGVLDDDDLSEISEEISDRMENEITASLGIDSLNISAIVDTQTDGIPPPDDGASLLAIIDSDLGLLIDIETDEPVEMDILDGYEENDVLGLLNGGLRILRDVDGIEDDMIDVYIIPPIGLYLGDETSVSNESGRFRYELVTGRKSIRSVHAPVYTSEGIGVDAFIDMSGIKSHYFTDAQIGIDANMTFAIDHLEFDPDDYPMDTSLNYSLDYLNADLIRLLIDMDIIQQSVLEDEMTERISSFLDDLIPEEEQNIEIIFRDGTLVFDGDYTNVNGEDPLVIDISITSEMNPFDSGVMGMMDWKIEESFLPYHTNPLIPIRTVERTLDLGEAKDWDLNLTIRFPSGMGVKGWLGNGTYHYSSKLDTEIVDGYPTLYLDPDTGSGDHLYLEMEFGAYFALNNFTVCFASIWIILAIIMLIILMAVIKRIRKRSKKKADEEGSDDADASDEKPEDDPEVQDWN